MSDTGFTETADKPKANGYTRPQRRFTTIAFHKVELPKGPPALVAEVLFAQTLAVIFGESGCGKSFFVSYLALHVAAGRTWAGKAVSQGVVVYVAAEGQRGFLKRLVAAREALDFPSPLPFHAITDAPDLGRKDGDAAELILRIQEQVGGDVALVVIDTLARGMGDGNENEAKDMGALIANADAIMKALGCTVALVHHVGKDASRGARGSSVLKAAADTEILVEKTDAGRTATVTKQKDGESGHVLSFELEPVSIAGSDETSCVVEVETWQRSAGRSAKKVTGPPLVALRALEECLADNGETAPPSTLIPRTKKVVRMTLWREACARVQITETDKPDAKRKAFKRAAEKLQTAGLIGVYDDFVWANR